MTVSVKRMWVSRRAGIKSFYALHRQIGAPDNHACHPAERRPHEMVEVGVLRERRSDPRKRGDKREREAEAQWPGSFLGRQIVPAMGQGYETVDRDNQDR